ncbi:large proline-rich protein BAG6-like isoform X4 [Ambystoma mexicanum]|uniref:large proline-rich protein BAG6-like isoform X4 n=1 Tax=Ambystoma mexicanum TaxID=8296 RepID=UPI0037E7BD0C
MAECNYIEVTVKTLDSQTRSFVLEAEMMVKDFKDYIAALVGIPPEKQRLIFQGRLLLDHKRLIDYNVNGKVLHLVERPPPQTQLSGTEPSGTGTSMQLVIAGSGAGANVPNYELSSYTREGLPGLLGIHTTSSPQSVPPLRSQSAPPPTTHGILDQQETCQLSPQSNPERAGSWFSVDEQIGPSEFFSSVLQGLLSSMMGSAEAPQGTIADFMHHLGGSSIIHDATTEGPIGFFQDLLSLICQHFSMVDIVMLPLQRIQPELNTFFREELLHNQEPTEQNIRMATDNLINELEGPISEIFVSVRVPEGLDITQTNVEFLQDHFHRIATHILHCSDHTFGTRLLELCNECLFQFIALNLHCLQEDQNALAAITFESFSLMLSGLNGSLVIVLVFMVAIQQQIIMEQVPVTQEQIMHYVRRTSDSCQEFLREDSHSPVDMQRYPGFCDTSNSGSPPKRRKFFPADGMPILLSEAVSRAADVLGITPLTNWECFKKDLEELAIEDSYKKQLQTDIQKRIQGDPEYSIQQFPNTHKVFQEGS